MTDTPPPGRFRRIHRHPVTRTILTLLAVFVLYRVIAVYRIRNGCGAPRPVAFFAAPQAAVPRPPGGHLTVLTYNIEGHAALVRNDHLEQIAEVIRDTHADVVGLEEVHRHTWQGRFRDQARELARMTGMSVAFAPSFSVLGGAFGNAILTRGTIRDAAVIDLPTLGEPRSMLVAHLVIDGRPLTFHTAHFAAWGGLNHRIRTRQVACVTSHVTAVPGDWVLVGDFNAAPSTGEITTALHNPALHFVNPLDAPSHRVLNQTIDYIIASPAMHSISSSVVQKGPSDHWPVVAEFEWKSSGKGVTE